MRVQAVVCVKDGASAARSHSVVRPDEGRDVIPVRAVMAVAGSPRASIQASTEDELMRDGAVMKSVLDCSRHDQVQSRQAASEQEEFGTSHLRA
jgi:hypothetical protein